MVIVLNNIERISFLLFQKLAILVLLFSKERIMKKLAFTLLLVCFPFYMSVEAQQKKGGKALPTKRGTKSPPSKIPSKSNTTPMTNTASQNKENLLTNADIIRMVKGGFTENIILNAIQTNKTQFNVSVNALFELKNAGVSQKVVEAMQATIENKQTALTVSKTGATPVSESPTAPSKNEAMDNPLSKASHQTNTTGMQQGVVLIDGAKRIEMKLSQSNMDSGGMSLGMMVPIFGKSKTKSTLKGNQSLIRLTDNTPEFEVMISTQINVADQVVLLKVKQKSNHREIEIAKMSMLKVSTGYNKDMIIPTTFEEIRTQSLGNGFNYILYRVKVLNPLPPGEYVFAPQQYIYYDFGVDSSASNKNSTSQQSTETSLPITANSNQTVDNQQVVNTVPNNSEIPEISINSNIDTVRGVILRQLVGDKYNLVKDEPSQLVFSKEEGGVGGFLGGVFFK
jgi:hypothetical protein